MAVSFLFYSFFFTSVLSSAIWFGIEKLPQWIGVSFSLPGKDSADARPATPAIGHQDKPLERRRFYRMNFPSRRNSSGLCHASMASMRSDGFSGAIHRPPVL